MTVKRTDKPEEAPPVAEPKPVIKTVEKIVEKEKIVHVHHHHHNPADMPLEDQAKRRLGEL